MHQKIEKHVKDEEHQQHSSYSPKYDDDASSTCHHQYSSSSPRKPHPKGILLATEPSVSTTLNTANEHTSLLSTHWVRDTNILHQRTKYNDSSSPRPAPSQPSPHDFYFPTGNPTIQAYYRFTVTYAMPFVTLHTQPLDGPLSPNLNSITSGDVESGTATVNTRVDRDMATKNHNNITGLLRRSAVLPSHGIDPSGHWILVSVGGRSGWARKHLFTPLLLSPSCDSDSDNEKHNTYSPSCSTNNYYRHAQLSVTSSIISQAVLPKSVKPTPTQPGGFIRAPSFRVSEGWMGNHVFLFNGKIMLGSDAPLFFITNLVLFMVSILHFTVILPHIQETPTQDFLHHHRWTVHHITFWFTIVLCISSIIMLWITAATDPGILPPVSSPIKPLLPKDGLIGGPLGYRYCSTCNIFRPPRSKHCNRCNVCVSHFDHHCPWIGNCVGERNYRFFFAFLISVSSLTILMTTTCIRIVFQAYKHTDNGAAVDRIWMVLTSIPMTVIMGILTLLCAWSLTSLTCFHIMIMALAQTTNERIRGVYRYGIIVNTADRGCCYNCLSKLCSTRPPSNLPNDFSDIVHCIEDQRVSLQMDTTLKPATFRQGQNELKTETLNIHEPFLPISP